MDEESARSSKNFLAGQMERKINRNFKGNNIKLIIYLWDSFMDMIHA